jgi:phosphate transport system substrate-binding protein
MLGLLLAAGGLACTKPEEETTTRGSLHLLVTESHAALMQQEAKTFERLYPEAKITIGATTTREAIVHLVSDSVRLICIDRALNAEEQAAAREMKLEISETKIAVDALAILVHEQNPAQQMSLTTLTEIMAGQKTSWNQVAESKWSGQIEIALTGRNSGAYELLARQFLPSVQDIPLALVAESQRQVLEYVSAHPRSLGVVSVAALQDSIPHIRTLALPAADSAATSEYVKLHQANIYRGWYPLRFPVFLYLTAERGSLASGFTAFVASHPGQKILLDAKLVPATMPVRLVQINEN